MKNSAIVVLCVCLLLCIIQLHRWQAHEKRWVEILDKQRETTKQLLDAVGTHLAALDKVIQ